VPLSVALSGIWFTVSTFALSATLAVALAIPLGCARVGSSRLVRNLALIWTEFFRGVSTVVLLFWLYYVLPTFGVSLTPMTTAVAGLALVHGAYGSEAVRGAILAVPPGQREAALALGFSHIQSLRLVILPQALSLILPVFGNSLVALLKATALASIIGLPELSYQANLSVSRTYAIAQTFAMTMVVYYAIAQGCQFSVRGIEKNVRRWRQSEFTHGF
jgi:polar amino acid transport system permease protein